MNITVISDTHNQHEKLGTLSGDVLIHCGDMFNLADRGETHVSRIDDWFGRQNFDLVLCTGGNHDLALQEVLRRNPQPFANATYLQDRKYVWDGVVFYGGPWTPMLSTHAFFGSDQDLFDKWSRIPEDTDVLITHTPPFSILDESSRGMILGCKHLAGAVDRIAPAVHCFGHVHHSAGMVRAKKTVFVNASSVNSQFELVREPIVVKI